MNDMATSHALEKVTAFVTRPTPAGAELLLFQHPHAGIQIPAGTVEEGEAVEQAALREATEETGLHNLTRIALLGSADEQLPPDTALTLGNTPVYTRPDPASWLMTRIRRGIRVQVNRKENGFSQITYQEWDRFPDPAYVTFNLTGWTPDEAITETSRRHFFQFEHRDPTPMRWTVRTDNHDFALFWAPLAALPVIVEPQQWWLHFLQTSKAAEG
jgi:8-oxo-dGTP pyrophosphatase MutT (NUDIX family)